MKVTVNQLGVEFRVITPRIKKSDNLEVRAVFTNESQKTIRLNALFLPYATVMLKIRKADGALINPSSPPLPPVDDGKTDRMELTPGESATHVYKGYEYLGAPLQSGEYEVRFRYDNSRSKFEEWKGVIETNWLKFEVGIEENLTGRFIDFDTAVTRADKALVVEVMHSGEAKAGNHGQVNYTNAKVQVVTSLTGEQEKPGKELVLSYVCQQAPQDAMEDPLSAEGLFILFLETGTDKSVKVIKALRATEENLKSVKEALARKKTR